MATFDTWWTEEHEHTNAEDIARQAWNAALYEAKAIAEQEADKYQELPRWVANKIAASAQTLVVERGTASERDVKP